MPEGRRSAASRNGKLREVIFLANTILTPVTLWKDFDESLPLMEEILSETTLQNGAVLKEVYFLGRETVYGRVKIYAKYFLPKDKEEYPVLMILFEAGFPFDEKLVNRFVTQGFGVLCVDYCGDMGRGRHTIYPRDIDFANYARAGRAMEYADKTARETSWYEWAAVARYAAKYLSEKKEVTAFGALGLRTGGEILWKIAPYSPLKCMIAICAAGWLAYRDMEKFAGGEMRVFNEERHRFIAGIDSQSYAPHVKCPVLMISAINDKKCNYDRVYDTFQQINPAVEKAIMYSSHGNGLIGSHSFLDIFMFLDKFLLGRSVYLSKPVGAVAFEDEMGNLNIKASYDPAGDPKECGIFFAEKADNFKSRDWTRLLGNMRDMHNNEIIFPLEVYEGSRKVLFYSFVRYSNGFSITSKIQEVTLKKKYRNGRLKTLLLYSGSEGTQGFSVFRRRASSFADCFADGGSSEVKLMDGYGKIQGVSAMGGIISFRVSEPRCVPPDGACFQFDAYAFKTSKLLIVFYMDAEEKKGFAIEEEVGGGGKWKNFLFTCNDFKSETGAPLPDFRDVKSVVFLSEDDVLINNMKWL